MKRIICLFLTVLMLTFSVVPAYGGETRNLKEENIVRPMFKHIYMIVAGIKINTSGKATVFGMGETYNASHIINLNVELQKYSGSGWSTIKNWTTTGPSTSMGIFLEKDWYVVKGTYRTAVTVKVYNSYGQLLETQTEYSPIEIY